MVSSIGDASLSLDDVYPKPVVSSIGDASLSLDDVFLSLDDALRLDAWL